MKEGVDPLLQIKIYSRGFRARLCRKRTPAKTGSLILLYKAGGLFNIE